MELPTTSASLAPLQQAVVPAPSSAQEAAPAPNGALAERLEPPPGPSALPLDQGWDPAAGAADTDEIVTFEQVLASAAGSTEAYAARQWLEDGQPTAACATGRINGQPREGVVYTTHDFDMLVGQRRHRRARAPKAPAANGGKAKAGGKKAGGKQQQQQHKLAAKGLVDKKGGPGRPQAKTASLNAPSIAPAANPATAGKAGRATNPNAAKPKQLSMYTLYDRFGQFTHPRYRGKLKNPPPVEAPALPLPRALDALLAIARDPAGFADTGRLKHCQQWWRMTQVARGHQPGGPKHGRLMDADGEQQGREPDEEEAEEA